MKRSSCILWGAWLLLSCMGFAETGRITRVESESYARSSRNLQNRVVYWIKTQAVTFKVTPRKHRDRAALEAGQSVEFRVERKIGKHGVIGKMFLPGNGKDAEYEIIGEAAE